MESQKFAGTYDSNIGGGGGSCSVTGTTRKSTESIRTSIDGSNELNDDCIGARIVLAAIELGKDSITLVAEVRESVLDVRDRPLRDDLGNNTGEGYSTGSEDSEDGRETHGEGA